MSAHRFNRQGGIERASLEVASRLPALGVDLTLVAASIDADVALDWERVPMPPLPGALVPAVYPIRASRRIEDLEVDLVHDQGACATTSRDIVTAHSCHRAWWELKRREGESLRAWLNPLHHAVLRREARTYAPGRYRRVIAVSAGVGRELTHHYAVPPELISVIPNGVDLDAFAPRADRRAEQRRELGFTDADVVLLFVGKEFRRKGLGPAIDALPHLPDTARLLVVGGDHQGPFRERAAAHGVAERVTFVGHRSDVHELFQAADAFVFPTRYEAFALVSLEAAAAGLPLVTTRVNGTEDLVVDGTNGFFVEASGASLAKALTPIVHDAELRARMSQAARSSVQDHSWDAVARRTRDVYAEVLEER